MILNWKYSIEILTSSLEKLKLKYLKNKVIKI